MFVYKITSKLNNKCYIGITNDFNRRMREHKTLHDKNSLIEQAIQLDGVNNFLYFIILEYICLCWLSWLMLNYDNADNFF